MKQREIKFRAWDKENGYMFDVGGIVWSVNNPNSHKYMERDIFNEDSRSENTVIEHESNSCILMQYTGLKDKNGVEIYEGDIIERQLWTKTFRGKKPNGKSIEKVYWREKLYPGFNIFNPETCEVIGNIYENPELI